MLSREAKAFSGRKFWRTYALAWLTLTCFYVVVFLIAGEGSVVKAAVDALVYVLPMALLGAAALAVFRRLDWTGRQRARFVAIHVVLGTVYGVTVNLVNHAFFSLLYRINPRLFRPVQFNLEYFTWASMMGILIYGVLAGLCYAIRLHDKMRAEEARAARATALQTQAELRALRAQVNPHFLFNTLHSLLALVRHDPRAAEEALEQFGDLLRYTLDTQKNGEVVPLREELAFVDNYLALESLRLGERLRLDVDVAEGVRDERVPAFSVQPLVENAIRHGIAPRAAGGRLALKVARDGATLRIEVADDGPGAERADLERGHGLGLRLVRERLATHYDGAASLEVDARPGRGLCATLRIPIDEEEA